jgi:hypothetical protein
MILILGVVNCFVLIAFETSCTKAEGTRSLQVWTTHALVKVQPDDPPPQTRSQSAEIWAARNEFESFQIILRATRGDFAGVDATVSDLRNAEGAIIPCANIAIYRETYLELRQRSSVEGKAGEWPDPLIPRVDRYWNERRNAFPFLLKRERNQPLWIEVYVPLDQPPGEYQGSITVASESATEGVIPFSVHVWAFTLPSTSSLQTAFGIGGISILKQHRGRYTSDGDLRALTRIYAEAALMHRISIYGGTMIAPHISRAGGGLHVGWGEYDDEEGPFLDGTVFGPGHPLPGARATSVDLRMNGYADSDRDRIRYIQEWVTHFKNRGWLGRLYYYVWDEPANEDYVKVAARGALARRAGPELKNLVTTSFSEQLASGVDIWAPLINCFDRKPGFPDFCSRSVSRGEYTGELNRGKRLWWYQSCASHGCAGSATEYFRGWPSYAIDVDPVSNRIMEWLTWKYRISGELYYNMTESYVRQRDPWQDFYLHGGNGDGSLFYPGRTDRIGGSRDIPIESIRLKLIRDGLEDYEYLTLLATHGLLKYADDEVDRLVSSTYSWEHNPELLYSIREEIGKKLDSLGRFGINDPPSK